MKNPIRWKGLVGFAITVLVLALFVVLFIDTIIKRNIESAASQLVGARVELARADFHFYPLGMELGRLQVTDPQRPMRNIVEIQHVSFNLDGMKLLRRKILINEMQVDGVRFDTPRRTSGALGKAKQADSKSNTEKTRTGPVRLAGFSLPDANEILAREELKTRKLAEKLQTDIKDSERKWSGIRKNLPAEERIDDYGKRLEKIRKVDVRDISQLAGAVKELTRMEKDIKADMANVDNAYRKINDDLQRLDKELKTLKQSPEQDARRLIEKYALSDDALANISQRLFGSKAKKYIATALDWYKKLEPLLAYVDVSAEQPASVPRSKGVDVRFREFNPAPDFLIREIRASIDTREGRFSGKILDLTNEQNLTRKPVTVNFSGKKLPTLDSIVVAGIFNRIDPARAKDRLHLTIKNYRLNQYQLLDRGGMKLSLDKAKADFKLDARRDDNNIMADLKLYIHDIEYNAMDSKNELASIFLSALEKTPEFSVITTLQGSLDDYTVRVSSDMDARLKNSMKKYMNTRLAGLRKALKEKIDRQVGQSINEVEMQYKNLQSEVDREISARRGELDRQLKSVEAEIRNRKKQASGKSRDKLERNIKGLLQKYQ